MNVVLTLAVAGALSGAGSQPAAASQVAVERLQAGGPAERAAMPRNPAPREARIRDWIDQIGRSGRVLEIGEARERLADPRQQIAPGAPPLLSFRYFQGADRHRFGKLDLMLDDAGH